MIILPFTQIIVVCNIMLQHSVALANALICVGSREGAASCRALRLLVCYVVTSFL
jgi:hypothetical protein